MNWSELVVVTLLLEPYSLKVTVGVPDYLVGEEYIPAPLAFFSHSPILLACCTLGRSVSSWVMNKTCTSPYDPCPPRPRCWVRLPALRYQPPCLHLTYLSKTRQQNKTRITKPCPGTHFTQQLACYLFPTVRPYMTSKILIIEYLCGIMPASKRIHT